MVRAHDRSSYHNPAGGFQKRRKPINRLASSQSASQRISLGAARSISMPLVNWAVLSLGALQNYDVGPTWAILTTNPNALVPSPSSGVSSSSRLQYIWHVAQKILFSLLRSSGVCKYQQAFSAVLSLRLEQVDTMHCGQLSASMVHPFSLQNTALHSADERGDCRRGDGRGRG